MMLKLPPWRFTIPNLLSLFRVVATPVLVVFIVIGAEKAFSWLILIAFFTDMLDGFIARKFNQQSLIGSVLDSTGDSLTILSGIVGLGVFKGILFLPFMPLLGTVLGLHVMQLILSLWRYQKPSAFHSYAAKVSAFAIGIFILVTLFFGFYPWLFYVTMVFLAIDALEESILVFMLPNWQTDVKGVWWILKAKKETH